VAPIVHVVLNKMDSWADCSSHVVVTESVVDLKGNGSVEVVAQETKPFDDDLHFFVRRERYHHHRPLLLHCYHC